MKKIVVIGGGFAGSHIAKQLERKFDVILVDTKDYFEFTPGILRTIVEPEHIRKIQVLHKNYLTKTKIVVDEVKEVGKNYVQLKNKTMKFDYLAICSGSSYNAPFKEQRVVTATRAKHLLDCYETLCDADKVLIAGGGLVGVELAGEIYDRYQDKAVTIVHAKERLMERTTERASSYAENYLRKKGAKFLFDERVVKKTRDKYVTNKGKKIKADIVFLCTGITPNFDFMKSKLNSCLNKKGCIEVNEHLQLINNKNIFAAGDINDKSEEKTAQNAERQAKVVVKNIIAMEEDKPLLKYKTKKTPLVISLGKHNGLFVYKNFTITGRIPGLLKGMIEKKEMAKKEKLDW
ncbi:FAD-dependent oxidoreductase [Candidatus Pacearchaeota archaeon]|nr:FAD-dependent oxidoreductase [Candidatus Pacearchaeota archaeon]